MSKKQKNLIIKTEVPSENHLKLLTDAVGIVNFYRSEKQLPSQGVDNFIINAVYAAAQNMMAYDREEQERRQKAHKEKAKVSEPTADTDTSIKNEETKNDTEEQSK
jgi:hypothetical protein